MDGCFSFNHGAAKPSTNTFLISEQGLTIFDFRRQTNKKSLFVNPRLCRAGLFVNRVKKNNNLIEDTIQSFISVNLVLACPG